MRNRTGDGGGFSRSTMRHCAVPGRQRRGGTMNREAVDRIRLLFHQLQQRTPALGLWRSGLLPSFRRRLIRQHRVAQSLQFRVGNPVEFHPKVENCHRDQQCSLAVAAVEKGSPAAFEGSENRIQSLF